jgi:hypothetical protein
MFLDQLMIMPNIPKTFLLLAHMRIIPWMETQYMKQPTSCFTHCLLIFSSTFFRSSVVNPNSLLAGEDFAG